MIARTEASDPLVGRVLDDKYRIEELLGIGAMGAVYRARHLALDRDVAVKVLSTALAQDSNFVARFHREAKTASRLSHANSVSVTDFGEEPDKLLYLVMELVPGKNLDVIIQEEFPLGQARIVSIMTQLLSAVVAAHDLGIIHRDLKPENLLVVENTDDDGEPIDIVKVCDFGIATMLGDEMRSDASVARLEAAADSSPAVEAENRKLTAIGLILGTPAYMSPEQAMGLELEAASDIYSIGVMLYEMLTRRLPFESETHDELVRAHLLDPPADPTTVVPSCSAELAAICMQALEKEPSNRFPTARAMRAAIRRIGMRASGINGAFDSMTPSAPITVAPTVTEPTTQPELETVSEPPAKAVEAPATRRAVYAGAFVAVLALAVAGGFVLRSRTPEPHPMASTSTAPAPSPSALAEPPLATPQSPPPVPPTTTEPTASATPTSTVAPTAVTLRSPQAPRATVSARPEPVVAPTAEPPPAPAPAPTPPPAPAPTPETPATPAPSPVPAPVAYSPARANVAVSITSLNGTTRATMGALLAHVSFDECYQQTLRTLGRAEGGAGTMHLELDEDGVVRSAVVRLPAALAAATACVSARIQRQRISKPPDTGSAVADLALVFNP